MHNRQIAISLIFFFWVIALSLLPALAHCVEFDQACLSGKLASAFVIEGIYPTMDAAESARDAAISGGVPYGFTGRSQLNVIGAGACINGGSPSGNYAIDYAYYTYDGKYHIYVVGEIWNRDADNDGIPDNLDLNPGSDDPYNAAITSVMYDSTTKEIVSCVITDSGGNKWMVGTVPDDPSGYTIESVEGNISYVTGADLAAQLGNFNGDLNLTPLGGGNMEIEPDSTYIPGSYDPLADWKQQQENQIVAPTPDINPIPTFEPDDTDTDTNLRKKIVSNTDATNKNLDAIAKYLRINNDYLAKLNAKKYSVDATVKTTGGTVMVKTPTAEEIGEAVDNSLIDSSQGIDTSITDNIPALDESTALTEIQLKYITRYEEFLTNIKSSDLFSLPFEIFSGPSGSGASIQTVSIGKWGSSSNQSVNIDFSEYDAIWQILRSVILLITSYACVKILILKKA
ncbi:MAG: hypothetical protein V6Z89_15200 [Desulfobacter sp.]